MARKVGTRKKGYCNGCGIKVRKKTCNVCWRYAIPATVVIEVLQKYFREGETWTEFSRRVGKYQDWGIKLKLQKDGVKLETMDQILCSLGDPLAWHQEPLKGYYWLGQVPPSYAKPVKCMNPRCDGWFSLEGLNVSHKNYCSHNCCNTHAQILRGIRRPKIGSPRIATCAWCEGKFEVLPTATGGRTTKYCSDVCRQQAKRLMWRKNYHKQNYYKKKKVA